MSLLFAQAQEIIDAFFIKFDEHVVLNRYNIPYGHTTYGSTCVVGRGGVPTFPTDSLNQWIQQVRAVPCTCKLEHTFNTLKSPHFSDANIADSGYIHYSANDSFLEMLMCITSNT